MGSGKPAAVRRQVNQNRTSPEHWKLFYFLPTRSRRSVLELGSGVGLTGIAVCCSCDPLRFVFSDCHPAVLQKLRENVRLNGFGEQTSPAVSVEELDWTTATEEQIRRIGADVVLAAGLGPGSSQTPVGSGGLMAGLWLPFQTWCTTRRRQEVWRP